MLFLALPSLSTCLSLLNVSTELVVFSFLLHFLVLAQVSGFASSYRLLLSVNISGKEPDRQDVIVRFVALQAGYQISQVAVILMHLFAVIVTEIHEGGSITSAMFTGRKLLNRPPQDR